MNFEAAIILHVLIILSVSTTYNLAIFFNVAKTNRPDFLNLQSLDARFNTPQGHELVTEFEGLRGPSRVLREWFFRTFNAEKSFQHNKKLGKIQKEIPANTPFPCDLSFARSHIAPTTVHKLRPGDIDIIAAIGDSMSAGTCLMTENFLQILYENRGLAFSGGGYGSWRQFLTLPNILKVFNPNLYGYAIADGISLQRTSRFNVAEPMAMSRDLVHQTKLLIKRMRQDPNVDLKRHWKLLTIFIGNVDYCGDYCLYDDVTIPLGYHEQDLRQSLTLLRDNVPRLFVNLLPAPNAINSFRNMNVSPHCYVIHHSFCFCVINSNSTDADRRAYSSKIHLWQDLDAHIASLDEFNTDDFAVVFHPFLNDPQAPVLPNGETDQRYFAADCFHFSQLGHASLANTLWNSMLQPVGHKQLNYNKAFDHFECPTLKHPYLATKRNSLNLRA